MSNQIEYLGHALVDLLQCVSGCPIIPSGTGPKTFALQIEGPAVVLPTPYMPDIESRRNSSVGPRGEEALPAERAPDVLPTKRGVRMLDGESLNDICENGCVESGMPRAERTSDRD